MKRDHPDIHRREFYPNTDTSLLFKAEQPEYVQPLGHVSASFVKMDFTSEGSKIPEINLQAERNEARMRVVEQIKDDKAKEFWELTKQRAAKIRRKQKIEQEIQKKEEEMRVKRLPNAKNFPKFQKRQDRRQKKEKIVVLGVGGKQEKPRKRKIPLEEKKKEEQREYYNNFINQNPVGNAKNEQKFKLPSDNNAEVETERSNGDSYDGNSSVFSHNISATHANDRYRDIRQRFRKKKQTPVF